MRADFFKSMTITSEISTREFFRTYAKQKKYPTVITFRGKPEGVYVPYAQWEALKKKDESQKISRHFTIDDLKPLFVKGPGNASEHVDDIYRM